MKKKIILKSNFRFSNNIVNTVLKQSNKQNKTKKVITITTTKILKYNYS